MTWVDDRVYAAGGDYLPSAWAEFRMQTGVRAVVHLRGGMPSRFAGPWPEAFLWLNAADEVELTDEHLFTAARFVAHAVQGGGRVLLHADRGMQRTRPVYSAFQLLGGKSVGAVLRAVEKKPWLKPYRGGAERLARFAEWLGVNGGPRSAAGSQKSHRAP